jgi:hypothetical protein
LYALDVNDIMLDIEKSIARLDVVAETFVGQMMKNISCSFTDCSEKICDQLRRENVALAAELEEAKNDSETRASE